MYDRARSDEYNTGGAMFGRQPIFNEHHLATADVMSR